MTWLETLKALVWPAAAPRENRTLAVPRLNGAALKQAPGWVMPPAWTLAGLFGGSITLTEGRTATYAQMYERQPWVHAVINTLVYGIGRLPLKAYGTDDGGQRFRLRNASLALLLDAPYERGSPTSVKQRIMGDMATYGNALVFLGRDSARAPATMLQPVHPEGWSLDADGQYHYRPLGQAEKVFPPYQLAHFRGYRPGDDLGWGLSRLEPLRQTLLIEDAAQRLAAFSFENGASPNLALETDNKMGDDEIARLRAQFESRHVGGHNAGRPVVLTGGLRLNTYALDFNQTAVIDHRQLTREEVCAVYNVPPPIVGILDHATFSNIEEQHLMLYMDTLGPWLTLIEETIQAQILRGVPEYAGQFVEFDINEVLKGNIQARYEAINKAVGGPWQTVNEARSLENWPRSNQPEAELVRFPLNMSSDPAAAQAAGNLGAAGKAYANGHTNGHAAAVTGGE